MWYFQRHQSYFVSFMWFASIAFQGHTDKAEAHPTQPITIATILRSSGCKIVAKANNKINEQIQQTTKKNNKIREKLGPDHCLRSNRSHFKTSAFPFWHWNKTEHTKKEDPNASTTKRDNFRISFIFSMRWHRVELPLRRYPTAITCRCMLVIIGRRE